MTHSEIEAANNAQLFNIPASVWRSHWHMLYGDTTDRIAAMYFWLGVYVGAERNSPDYEDRALLCDISTLLLAGIRCGQVRPLSFGYDKL